MYNVEDCILDRLEFYVVTKIGKAGNTKYIMLDKEININTIKIREHDKKDLPSRIITLADIRIRV